MSFAQKRISKVTLQNLAPRQNAIFFNETLWKHLRLNKLRLFPSLAVKEIEKKTFEIENFYSLNFLVVITYSTIFSFPKNVHSP